MALTRNAMGFFKTAGSHKGCGGGLAIYNTGSLKGQRFCLMCKQLVPRGQYRAHAG